MVDNEPIIRRERYGRIDAVVTADSSAPFPKEDLNRADEIAREVYLSIISSPSYKLKKEQQYQK